MQVFGEIFRDMFYVIMFLLLLNTNTDNWNTVLHLKLSTKNARASSHCVMALVFVVLLTKGCESILLASLGYQQEGNRLFDMMKKSCRTQDAERTEETANDRTSDSDTRSMKGYEYAVCIRQHRFITIDQIWGSCANSADGKALKDLCLSFTFFWRLVGQRYFGIFYPDASRLEAHNFFFKKLLPSKELSELLRQS